MINIHGNLYISYDSGYFQTHEHSINKEGKKVIKPPKTYPCRESCYKDLKEEGVSKECLDKVCNKLIEDYPLLLAKKSANIKKKRKEKLKEC